MLLYDRRTKYREKLQEQVLRETPLKIYIPYKHHAVGLVYSTPFRPYMLPVLAASCVSYCVEGKVTKAVNTAAVVPFMPEAYLYFVLLLYRIIHGTAVQQYRVLARTAAVAIQEQTFCKLFSNVPAFHASADRQAQNTADPRATALLFCSLSPSLPPPLPPSVRYFMGAQSSTAPVSLYPLPTATSHI